MLVQRLYKQRSSLVMTVPKLVCKKLKLCAGDYVLLRDSADSRFIFMSKLKPEDIPNGRDKGNSDREDSGGRT